MTQTELTVAVICGVVGIVPLVLLVQALWQIGRTINRPIVEHPAVKIRSTCPACGKGDRRPRANFCPHCSHAFTAQRDMELWWHQWRATAETKRRALAIARPEPMGLKPGSVVMLGPGDHVSQFDRAMDETKAALVRQMADAVQIRMGKPMSPPAPPPRRAA